MPLSAEARARLEWIRDDYVALVRSAAPCELLAPSDGTRWTNRELLFHMWFGQRIARALIPVMGAFSQVPPSVSQAYAGMLSAATRPYTWVNYAAAVGGARAAGLERAERWMIADTAWLLRWAGRASDADLARGMSVPPGWDPYFPPWMSRADVMDWLPKHYQHHRAQLTLGR